MSRSVGRDIPAALVVCKDRSEEGLVVIFVILFLGLGACFSSKGCKYRVKHDVFPDFQMGCFVEVCEMEHCQRFPCRLLTVEIAPLIAANLELKNNAWFQKKKDPKKKTLCFG